MYLLEHVAKLVVTKQRHQHALEYDVHQTSVQRRMLEHVEDARDAAARRVAAEEALQLVVNRAQHLGLGNDARAHARVLVT